MDLIEQLSELTTIDKKYLDKLFKKIPMCICENVHQSLINNENRLYCDLGFGSIGIDLSSGDSIKYKFIPSKDFEKDLVSTISSGQSFLIPKVEKSLVDKITNIYKDLL